MCTECMSGILKGQRALNPGIKLLVLGTEPGPLPGQLSCLSSALTLLFSVIFINYQQAFFPP